MSDAIDRNLIRSKFPALACGYAFMDNAGGSQVPAMVPEAIRVYMTDCYVQVGANYPASVKATETVTKAHQVLETLMGAEDKGRVIIGPSSSYLLRMLSDLYAEVLKPGDEIVVAEIGHEANVFPWVALEKRGITVHIWKGEAESGDLRMRDLKALLNDRTRIVAFPHVSNILGTVENLHTFIKLAHAVGARVVLDSVAYAPHAALKAAEWGVDWCVFSCYKVFGPHLGALYGSNAALAEVTGRNHPFIAKDYFPGKFELGGMQHELCAGILALPEYFQFLADRQTFDRTTVEAAFVQIETLERPLTEQLIDFLRSKSSVKIIGLASSGPERVATVSFIHHRLSSKEIAVHAESVNCGVRYGNFYSVRLLEHLGIDPADGVARVSFAHYNSPTEVDRLLEALSQIL